MIVSMSVRNIGFKTLYMRLQMELANAPLRLVLDLVLPRLDNDKDLDDGLKGQSETFPKCNA